ncbi:hypothetical protein QP162_18405 [Sphingomonas aurantiaca]|uniref:hypothetical protein n=1 Tax=Sphingomonas aurantiaca TaxID=185949 RepID=UPI002FDFBAD8
MTRIVRPSTRAGGRDGVTGTSGQAPIGRLHQIAQQRDRALLLLAAAPLHAVRVEEAAAVEMIAGGTLFTDGVAQPASSATSGGTRY